MLVAVGGYTAGDVVGDRVADLGEMCEGGIDVDGVPADDGVGEQGKALGLEVLVVRSALGELPEVGEEDFAAKSVERFTFVELDENAPSVFPVVEVAHERDRLDDPSVFLDRLREIVLSGRSL